MLYFNALAYTKSFKGSVLTNSSSGIQHAWHFWYAVISMLKCNAEAWLLRASPLNWALVANEKNVAKTVCLGLITSVFFAWFCVSSFRVLSA